MTAAAVARAVRTWAIRLTWSVARRLPLRQRVVLASSHRAQLDGNLACIAAEMLARDPPLRPTVLTYRERRGWRAWRTLAAEMAAAYYLATSRLFVVDDHLFPLHVVGARPGSTVVQAWHACGAFKKFGLSRPDRQARMERGAHELARAHRNYNLFLASSRLTAECYAEAFGQPVEKFEWDLGIPRTDLLFGREPAAVESIRARLKVPSGRRVILYAPTFRGSTTTVRSPTNLNLRTLQHELGADHVLLLRLHPKVASAAPVDPALSGFVIDVSDYPEINELMLVSDVLVTDYSSVIFEFSLLDRPILLFAPDHAEYERERGFYFDYRKDGPGPVFDTTAGLAEHLRSGQFDMNAVRRFRERWFEIADGHSSQRFVDQIVLPALAAAPPRGSAARLGPFGT